MAKAFFKSDRLSSLFRFNFRRCFFVFLFPFWAQDHAVQGTDNQAFKGRSFRTSATKDFSVRLFEKSCPVSKVKRLPIKPAAWTALVRELLGWQHISQCSRPELPAAEAATRSLLEHPAAEAAPGSFLRLDLREDDEESVLEPSAACCSSALDAPASDFLDDALDAEDPAGLPWESEGSDSESDDAPVAEDAPDADDADAAGEREGLGDAALRGEERAEPELEAMKDYPPRAPRREPQIAWPGAARRLSRQMPRAASAGPFSRTGRSRKSPFPEEAVLKTNSQTLKFWGWRLKP